MRSSVSLRFALLASAPLIPLGLIYQIVGPYRALPGGLSFSDWISYVALYGVWVSLLGFWIAITQLRRTRSAAQAAEYAATEARQAIAERMALGEYGIAAELCVRASTLISEDNLAAAEELLRRLRRAVGEANRLAKSSDDDLATRMQEIVNSAVTLEEAVAAATAASRPEWNSEAVRVELKRLEIQLSDAHSSQRLSSLLR